MTRILVGTLALALIACGSDRSAERHGFVTLLGHDTVAVEAVARRGDTLTVESVDQWPLVQRRHTRIELASDGTIRHFVMEISAPNAPKAKDRERRVSADFTPDSIHVVSRDGNGDHPFAFATEGLVSMPHVPQSYALTERTIAAALERGRATNLAPGDSVMFHQFYPDFDVSRFPLHDGFVHPLADGTVKLWHDWLSGIGVAKVDSAGRLLSYSGAQSTYKVEMTRTASPPDVEGAATRLLAAEKARGANQLSVRDTARGTIGAASFSVDYGRPLARGRTLIPDVIPLDRVWRTGANAATQFTTSAPITLAGIALKAGTYTLWTVPRDGGRADLVVNSQTGQWGTGYDDTFDVGMAALTIEPVTAPVERFTIAVTGADASHGALTLAWGAFRWTAPIVVR